MIEKKSVFVLEDDDDLRELFTYILETESYAVKAFPNATSFKENILIEHPNIVIMDVMLPDGNGIEICAAMKKDAKTAHIPVIIMSANWAILKMKEGCQAEDYILKPFDVDHLLKRVKEIIHNN